MCIKGGFDYFLCGFKQWRGKKKEGVFIFNMFKFKKLKIKF